ncbi:heavy metal-associated domain-containing protein [Lachnospiraceae bacterium 45-P1]
MKTYTCEEMMCEGCVARIHKALEAASIEHKVDLATKTVSVEGSADCEKKAVEILDDLGFSAVEK